VYIIIFLKGTSTKVGSGGHFVGDQVLKLGDSLSQSCPIQRGIIVDWGGMESMWRHLLADGLLRVDPSESYISMTEHTFNTKSNREKIVQVPKHCY